MSAKRHHPKDTIKNFSDAVTPIEKFAKKASLEISKGTLLGIFYSVITLMLLALLAIFIIATIITVSNFFPENYKIVAVIIITLIILGLFMFFWKFIINSKLLKEEETVEKISKKIDSGCYVIIQEFGKLPEGKDHFNDRDMDDNQKIAIRKLVDLGIIYLASKSYKNGYEYAYRWTELGYELMDFLEIKKMSEDEFKSRPEYFDYESAVQKYKEFKKEVDK